MRVIMTTGSFDLLHVGHINLLRRAKELGDYLIVGLNGDELIKWKNPIYTYEERKTLLESIKYVDEVVPINEQDDKIPYLKKIDLFVIGSDYKDTPQVKEIEQYVPVRILERTPNVSSTKTKKLIMIPYERKMEVLEAIQQFKIFDNKIFLQGGTMLGCVRENALIDNDDDIDIAYISKYHTQLEIKKEMLDIYRNLIDKGLMYKYFDLDYKEVFKFDNLVDGRGQCHIKINDFIIDLWTVWVDEEGYINFCDIPKICKANDFMPLKIGKVYDLDFNIPKNAEELLEIIYGEDWKTPQSKKPIQERKTVLTR